MEPQVCPPVLPCTTKRRTTTNLKTKIQPELPENRTIWKSDKQEVKEETFIQTSRRAEMGNWGGGGGGPARRRLADQKVPHLPVDKPGGTTGDGDRLHNPALQHWDKKISKPLAVKICRGCGDRRNRQPHRRVHWRDPWGPRMYTSPPTQKSAPEGPNSFVGSRRSY